MAIELNVLTLNAWGIPLPLFGSADRHTRMQHIAEELATGKYDLVGLEEIWSDHDFERIKEHVKSTLPYAHYFHSGCIGSGVCVLSRYPITSSLMHRYSLNGFAHHIHRGDWFGGKVVGLARIQIQVPERSNPISVHFYVTHIHAEYNRDNDIYISHRVVQAFELSNFIRFTSESADLCVLVGDLNLEPVDLGYQLVRANAELRDAWCCSCKANSCADNDASGNTCDVPTNKYTMPAFSKDKWPDGRRIDYIMYKTGTFSDVRSQVLDCHTTMNRIREDCDDCFSDHVAVHAQFRLSWKADDSSPRPITHSLSKMVVQQDLYEGQPLLTQALGILADGEKRVRYDRNFFMATLVFLLFIFVYTVDLELSYPMLTVPAVASRFVLTLMISFCLWYGLIGLRLEEKAMRAAREGMTLMLDRPKDMR